MTDFDPSLLEDFDDSTKADDKLRSEGFIDDNGLTPKGKLRVLQLRTLKCIAERRRRDV